MTFAICHSRFHVLRVALLSMCIVVMGTDSGFAQTRAAIPVAEKQKEIAKLLEETYNLAKLDGVSKKQNAVKQLIEASRDDSFGTDERYVILVTTISLAKEIGDATNWLEAVNSLVTDFDLNSQKEKTRLLTEFLNASKSGAQMKLVIDEALALSQAAAQDNQFAEANALLGTAESAIRRVTGTASLKPAIAAVRVEVTAREKEWKAFQAASAKLATNADDPVANYAIGRWHALLIADWKAALPFLAKASDPKWKAAAELELTEPTDATAQAAIGDAWWDVAQKESAASKTAVLLHAGEWYEEGQPNLTSALKKQLVGKRLEEIASLRANDSSTSALPKTTGSNSKGSQVSKPAKVGEWVDVLQWTEGVDWSNSGINWNGEIEGKPSKNGIKLRNGEFAHFPLSAILDGDYDMEAVFTRHEGAGDADIQFPVGIHTMLLALGSGFGSRSFVAHDGKGDIERHPGSFSNKEPHRVLIRVRRDGEKASFNIDFDNVKDYLKWEGAYSALRDTDSTRWKTTSLQRPWIGSYENNNLVFNQVRVRMLSGTITRDSITDVDRKQDLKNGYVRLVGEKPIALKSHEGMFSVNQLSHTQPPLILERWPRVSREFKFCDDYYGAHAPSRLKCPIPAGAKSFSVVGYNCASGSSKFLIEVDGKQVHSSATTNIDIVKVDLPPKASFVQLVADPGEIHSYDHVYWCYPRFHAVTAERVTDKMLDGKPGPLPFVVASSEVGAASLTHNKPIAHSPPVNFRDAVPCHEFIFAHAPSSIKYQIPDGMTRFTAIGSTPLSNSAKYEVWADGKLIYSSPQAGLVPIDIKLPARSKVIELKNDHLDDATADHSYWCYPRLHRD
ncbi:MAG: hypothetical protein JWP89_1448 [Schlesneria sp.]|nr:hypothetical protein [Schlesneria sp.]